MQVDVRCPGCHRQERWRDDGGEDPVIEVLVEGGGRRPAIDPQWSRGRVALAAHAGETGPVLGVCPACGQLLLAEDPATAWPAMNVRIDTPDGALRVEAVITGPDGGRWTRDRAEAFLERQYRVPFTEGLAGDLGRSVLFLGLLGPALLWVLGLLFVIGFLASIYQGPASAVSGTPGWDLTASPPAE